MKETVKKIITSLKHCSTCILRPDGSGYECEAGFMDTDGVVCKNYEFWKPDFYVINEILTGKEDNPNISHLKKESTNEND